MPYFKIPRTEKYGMWCATFAPLCSCPSASQSSYDASPCALGKPSPFFCGFSLNVQLACTPFHPLVLLACTPVPQQCFTSVYSSLLPHCSASPISAKPFFLPLCRVICPSCWLWRGARRVSALFVSLGVGGWAVYCPRACMLPYSVVSAVKCW